MPLDPLFELSTESHPADEGVGADQGVRPTKEQAQATAPRGINQGRMWMESYNQPAVVGHVLVMPGDVIPADSDGVVVVPRAKAEQVAEITRWIFEDDELKRGKINDNVGRPHDWTLTGHTQPPPPTDRPLHPAPVWDGK